MDERRNVDKLIVGLVLVCLGLLWVDLFHHKHVHFTFEQWFGFFAGFGLLSGVGLVLAARAVRKLLKRREDYYDRGS